MYLHIHLNVKSFESPPVSWRLPWWKQFLLQI